MSRDDARNDLLRKVIGCPEYSRTKHTLNILAPIITEIANLKLRIWLDAAPTVYGRSGVSGWFLEGPGVNTHEGKLVCIERI